MFQTSPPVMRHRSAAVSLRRSNSRRSGSSLMKIIPRRWFADEARRRRWWPRSCDIPGMLPHGSGGPTHGYGRVVQQHLLDRCLRKISITASKIRPFWSVPSPGQRQLPQCPAYIDIFGATVDACAFTSATFAGPSALRLLCFSESETGTSWEAF